MLRGEQGDDFFWVAPVADQTRIAYNNIIHGLPRGTFTAFASPVPRIELLNGTTLYFKSGDNPNSLFGYASKASVVDEASRCKPESWEAVLSTLTATHGPVRVIGNVQGKRNWFYALCRRIESGLEPNGHYARITYLDAIEAGIITAESVEEERRNMSAAAFRELFEAIARDDSGNPFGEEHIYACVNQNGLSLKPPVAFGIDLAKSHDWFVIIGLDEDGAVCVFERWQGIPWRDSICKAHRIIGEDVESLVDSTGVGDPVLEEFQSGHANFKGFHFHRSSKQRLMEGLAVGIQGHEISYPDGPIKGELLSFEYAITPTGMLYSAPSGEYDDCVCALALARQQWIEKAPGTNIMQYMIQTSEKTARLSKQPDADLIRESNIELMPWRQTSVVNLDNELTKLYKSTLRSHSSMRHDTTCARCGELILGPSRVSDGVYAWHDSCCHLGLTKSGNLYTN